MDFRFFFGRLSAPFLPMIFRWFWPSILLVSGSILDDTSAPSTRSLKFVGPTIVINGGTWGPYRGPISLQLPMYFRVIYNSIYNDRRGPPGPASGWHSDSAVLCGP